MGPLSAAESGDRAIRSGYRGRAGAIFEVDIGLARTCPSTRQLGLSLKIWPANELGAVTDLISPRFKRRAKPSQSLIEIQVGAGIALPQEAR